MCIAAHKADDNASCPASGALIKDALKIEQVTPYLVAVAQEQIEQAIDAAGIAIGKHHHRILGCRPMNRRGAPN
jgi:hypothetical protein